MSEELIQKGLTKEGEVFGIYEYFNLGRTNISNLKKYKIIPNAEYKDYLKKAPDGIIVDRRNSKNISVIAVVEYKNSDELNTKTKITNAIKQCNTYCEVLQSKIGIITNGDDCYWINPQVITNESEIQYKDAMGILRGYSFIKDENDALLRNIFDPSNNDSIELINKLVNVISKTNSSLIKSNYVSPASLAKKVWQSVWLATGDDPKKCLMTFTELFIFKFLSDLNILRTNNDGAEIDFNTVYLKGTQTCLKYYLSNVRPYIKSIFPLSKTDSTTIINGLSLKKDQNQDKLFFEILKAFNEYGELKNIDPSFKSRLFEDFLKGTTGKKQLAQFFTPRNIIKAIIDMADVKNLNDGSNVLDPSGGVGGFIIETILNRINNNKKDFFYENDILHSKINYKSYDYDEATVILAKANLLLCLTEILEKNPTLTEGLSKVLHDTFHLSNKEIIGSLELTNENYYDLIISNPPYVSQGLSLYRDFIKDNGILKSFYNIPSVGKEGLFIQKIVKELKENGRSKAFIVLPNGFFYRPADNSLKEFIIKNCYIDCIISLPEKAFYATTKKTYILGITKKEDKNSIQTHKVLCGIIEHIGEELNKDRIPINQNDLISFVSNYKLYNADRDNFKPKNKKIKLIDFNLFSNNLNWIIENYWSKEEKIALGLYEEARNLTEKDLFESIDSFKINLDEIKNNLENNFSKLNQEFEYHKTTLDNKDLFKLNTKLLGFTRKDYSQLNTDTGIPIYTATMNPVAYIKKLKDMKPYNATIDNPHISFASDGDGTAGKNIVYHTQAYYLNTSRISIEILDKKIIPKYVYYFIQDIKERYKFNFTHKANINNLKEIKIYIPIDDNGDFDIKAQEVFISEYENLLKLKSNLINDFFEKIEYFKKDIDGQLDIKFKEYFDI